MARYTRLQALNAVHEIGVVPVFYNGDIATAQNIAKACVNGGIKVLEFTNRGDHAWEVFTALDRFCAAELPDAILGAGSVLDAGTASMYISSGASFIVGPVTNPDVAKVCNRRNVGYVPGCGTASEISAAEELGCEIVKAFPGSAVGGPSFVKDVLAPMNRSTKLARRLFSHGPEPCSLLRAPFPLPLSKQHRPHPDSPRVLRDAPAWAQSNPNRPPQGAF